MASPTSCHLCSQLDHFIDGDDLTANRRMNIAGSLNRLYCSDGFTLLHLLPNYWCLKKHDITQSFLRMIANANPRKPIILYAGPLMRFCKLKGVLSFHCLSCEIYLMRWSRTYVDIWQRAPNKPLCRGLIKLELVEPN
jgi:hypothetical protein